MYKIGEFSKITNLTTKALRYYDEQGILKPSSRSESEYRMYSQADYEKALLIAQLRNLDFSIAEIKDVLSSCESFDDIYYYLSEKKVFIEKRIKEEKALIKKLEEHLLPKSKEVIHMNYDIEVKTLEPIAVASTRFRGKYSDVGHYIGAIYKFVKDKAVGAPFNCYYDQEYKEDAEIELCVPTKEVLNNSGSDIICKRLPKIRGIATVHTGSYETLNLAYKALLDYAKENSIECKTPSREIYHKGPGAIFKGNPDKYVTEIIIPFEEN
jgi:DNA-binding transcriptional MerR regulator